MSRCTELVNLASAGVAPALRAVDCVAGEMTASAFNRLFGAEGAMAPVLTILLTLYIAFFAISLLTGRSSLGISALTPRILTLGLVLTFATSWIAYQGLMWNLAVGAPDWIAGVLMGEKGSATQIFADRIDIVFGAIGTISDSAGQGAAAASEGAEKAGASGMFKPSDVMWLGALLLMLGTVGVLLTARIALAVLLALGPIFVVMALFDGTRGLTAGWLRGVALTALTPLFVVLGGGITLELLVPVLSALANSAEGITGRGAMAVFLIAAVHVALMIMVMKVAGTLVGNWQVFGLAKERRVLGSAVSSGSSGGAAYSQPSVAAPSAQASATSGRSAVFVAPQHESAVSLATSHGETGRAGDRRAVVTQISGGGIEPLNTRGDVRARGIGSRFRPVSNDVGRPAARELIR